ncbi:M61 glycyl aminopeptidase [Posidoniimonas corsicana]|uniref:M61 glycyl aminopeptidase n=1 Tax=Posidoniimonas corsicana TaxID=1938618 RepID=A0A5C5VGH9_9BACT|nr:M61 family metallopeptidase [Posidoniimonas corsicana]TWT36742.1 M61 glycyl aminopeptidase [Posidoniimonas corsicana]
MRSPRPLRPFSPPAAFCSASLAAITLLATTAPLPAAEPVKFELSALDGASQQFAVTMRLHAPNADAVTLCMPTWTPGYYQLVDYAKEVSGFDATTSTGEALGWTHDEPNCWRVQTGGAGELTVRYRVRAAKQFCANSYLDAKYGYACPTGVFLYQDGRLDQPAEVRLELPSGWQAATGLTRVGGVDANRFRADDFDQLYDRPILMGTLERIDFDVNGVPHAMIAPELGRFDRAEFTHHMTRMIESAAALIGETPYQSYQFLGIGPGPGGIEHGNSCVIGYSPSDGRSPTRSPRFMNFVTHEYFHLFNAKRIRPVELGPFDYSGPNRTRMLWVAEGFTMYYEHLILRRAGLTTTEDMLASLARPIYGYESKPGRLLQSAADASWNTWTDGPFGAGEDKISCYDKGAGLALLIDFAIRHASGNERSLDDVMRTLYFDYHKKLGRGYTPDEFRAACEQAAGEPLTDVLGYAWNTAPIDYDTYLGYGGLRLELDRGPEGGARLVPIESPTPRQAAVLESWLTER